MVSMVSEVKPPVVVMIPEDLNADDGWNNNWWITTTISEIFFRCVRSVCPLIGEVGQIVWNYCRSFYHFCEVYILRGGIRILKNKVHELTLRVHQLAIGSEGLRVERDLAIHERDKAISDREEIILNRAPLLIERDQLSNENKGLKLKVQELENAVADRADLENRYRQALMDLGVLQAQCARAKQSEEVIGLLSSLCGQLEQIPEKGSDEVTQTALETWPRVAKEYKEKLHNTLRDAISKLDPLCSAAASLNGILRVSEDDINHLEWISKVFRILEQLRQPLHSVVSNFQNHVLEV